ncbi:hypothetical protein AWB67_07578 [Caballeronia terrestris]|uniref:Uncharacterized protein n=1 Tax=Caballeronia terrestris TaxID=1226301 RepID=A0A158L4P4_9BURK|nr:hypothetical protein AWB67_07578 [Caballeronia terrestris]
MPVVAPTTEDTPKLRRPNSPRFTKGFFRDSMRTIHMLRFTSADTKKN